MPNEDGMEYCNVLAARIKVARGDISLRDFASKCDISHTHLDSIEKGVDSRTGKPVSVRIETVIKLSIGTGYSIEYLIGLNDDPYEGTMYKSGKRIKLSSNETSSSKSIKIKSNSKHEFDLAVKEKPMIKSYRLLNAEGQEKVIAYIADLISSKNYIKNNSNRMAKKSII